MISATTPTGNTVVLDWLRPLIDKANAVEVLIGIAGIAVVVWTAGFVVRAIGHTPNRGLVTGMNYAQLSFMGALVAAFLTPLALQAVAVLFLIQALWTITSVVFIARMKFSDRTFGQQQVLKLLGLADGGYVWYFVSEALYVLTIVVIVIWPSRVVVLPLAWLALYGSYQILISFLYQPTNAEQAAIATPVSQVNASLANLVDMQNSIQAALDSSAILEGLFKNRAQDYLEAKAMLRSLQEATLGMTQFEQLAAVMKPVGVLLCSGYVHGLISHRAAAARLYELVIGLKYAPQTAMQLIDELRPLAFSDHPDYSGFRALQFVARADTVHVSIRDSKLNTVERDYSLLWLGNSYYQESCTALLTVLKKLTDATSHSSNPPT